MGEKIWNITEVLSCCNTLVGSMDENEDKAINKNILKVKDLRVKYLRSEKTSKLMEEFLAKDVPYVQRKFRVKVNRDTHNDELSFYKLDAQRNARTKIALMKCRMKRWEDESNILKTNISTAFSNPIMKHETKLKYE